MTEAPHEHHNRVATEIVNRIILEFASSDRFVVVESIIAGVIGTFNFKQTREAGAEWALNQLMKGARERILSSLGSKESRVGA
jgi:hypothetical protein